MSHSDEALGLSLPSLDTPLSISVGGSPFTYRSPGIGSVYVTGGTVSAISIARNGVSVGCGITSGSVAASKDDLVTVSYSVLPTMTFIKR